MAVPKPTWIYRIIHIDNLETCLQREFLCAPNHTPADGLPCRIIHNAEIQAVRSTRKIGCGPGGVVHDYVPFYFGPRSPMLYQLHTGWVSGYTEGQEPIIYLVSSVQKVAAQGQEFVFSDGHGITAFTSWFSDVDELEQVDWDAVKARIWKDTDTDPDRQRRKQEEFLIHRRCDWSLIQGIGVIDDRMRARVKEILAPFGEDLYRPVRVKREWYY